MSPQRDGPLFASIVTMLDALERKLTSAPPIDNMRVQGIWLQLYGDGSGVIWQEWSKSMPGEVREERLLHAIFTKDDALLEFDSVAELHSALLSRAGTT